MKSNIFSLLPIIGFAAAAAPESSCSLSTTTKIELETVYETASVPPVPEAAAVTSSSASVCIPATVTETKREKVYVTVTAGQAAAEDAPSGTTMTTTSTRNLYTTVTIRPSGGFYGNHSAPAIFKSTTTDSGYPVKTPDSASKDKTPDSDSTGEGEDDDSDSCDADLPPAPTSSPIASPTPVPYGKAPQPSPSSSPVAEAAKSSPAADADTPAISPKSVSTTSAAINSGKVTSYGGNIDGGTCLLTGYTLPKGVFGTALTDSDWNSAGNCGACMSVTGPSGKTITAMVVDQCPGCGPHHLDLFTNAFTQLADLSLGVMDVKWQIVPCGITTPFKLRNKSGTSAHWFSMQVINSNVAVKTLEVSTDGGKTWMGTVRQPYNFFEKSTGFGTDKVDVKVTSTSGQSIIVKDVSVAAGTTKDATSNFSS
ncbi:hypothetical protein ACJQWK_09460 [Exserohilum turcicum]